MITNVKSVISHLLAAHLACTSAMHTITIPTSYSRSSWLGHEEVETWTVDKFSVIEWCQPWRDMNVRPLYSLSVNKAKTKTWLPNNLLSNTFTFNYWPALKSPGTCPDPPWRSSKWPPTKSLCFHRTLVLVEHIPGCWLLFLQENSVHILFKLFLLLLFL